MISRPRQAGPDQGVAERQRVERPAVIAGQPADQVDRRQGRVVEHPAQQAAREAAGERADEEPLLLDPAAQAVDGEDRADAAEDGERVGPALDDAAGAGVAAVDVVVVHVLAEADDHDHAEEADGVGGDDHQERRDAEGLAQAGPEAHPARVVAQRLRGARDLRAGRPAAGGLLVGPARLGAHAALRLPHEQRRGEHHDQQDDREQAADGVAALHDVGLAAGVLEDVPLGDRVQPADQQAADVGEERAEAHHARALVVVAGQLHRERAVGHGEDRQGRVEDHGPDQQPAGVEQVAVGVAEQAGRPPPLAVLHPAREHAQQQDARGTQDGTDEHVRPATPEAASAVVADAAHHRVDDGVPEPRHEKRHAQQRGVDAQGDVEDREGVVLRQVNSDVDRRLAAAGGELGAQRHAGVGRGRGDRGGGGGDRVGGLRHVVSAGVTASSARATSRAGR